MHRAHVVLIAVLASGLALGLVFAGGAVAEEVAIDVSEEESLSVSESAHQTSLGASNLECAYPVEVTDATGETVTVEEEPEEVVVLGASDAQKVWALGAQDRVTGMPIFPATEYLDDREGRTNVVDEVGFPVVEEVVGLEPDLVLAASATPPDDVEAIRDAGVTVYHAPTESSLEDVYVSIERVGLLLGLCDEAEERVTDMQETISAIEEAVQGEDRPSVYYAQDPEDGWTVGAGTIEDQMISIAGGENIATDLGYEFYDQISEEEIVSENPDWIVIGEGLELPDEAAPTTAVEEDQIVRVDTNAISQPGPRMIEPIEGMAEAFHPDAIEGTDDADDVGDTDTGDADDTDDADDSDVDDADDDGAGLTIIAAALGLIALAVFASRR